MRRSVLAALMMRSATCFGGGFPLVAGGKLIGAVRCSGGTGDQDAAACKIGADLVK